jgi:hypothetical protein
VPSSVAPQLAMPTTNVAKTATSHRNIAVRFRDCTE